MHIFPYLNSYVISLSMGSREIQSVFNQCRNIARRKNPKGVPLINKIERICLSNYNGKLSTEKARIAIRSALFEHNQNPSMLDMAEAQAKSSKMLAIVPDYVPSTQGDSVVGLLNKKSIKQKPVVYTEGIFSKINTGKTKNLALFGNTVKPKKQKGLFFSPNIVGGKVNNNKTIFNQFTNKNQIQTKGIFSGVNFKQTNSSNGIFSKIKTKSKPIKLNFNFNQSKSNGVFGSLKQNNKGKQKSIVELMKEVKK